MTGQRVAREVPVALVDPAVQARWERAFAAGSDKAYPSLDLVRLEMWHLQGGGARLLEYGCGSGVNTLHLLGKGYRVTAVDAAPSSLKLVERKANAHPDLRKNLQLQLVTPQMTRLPFEDGTFDHVVCVSVLSLMSTKQRIRLALSEFSRVLKPGGRAIFDINGPESDFAVKSRPLGDDVYELPGQPGEDPVRCICLRDEKAFAGMLDRWEIDGLGFAAHRYMGRQIQEFIACVRKP